jgi:hypothetical protein
MIERGRQAFAPETSVISAASKQEGEAGATTAFRCFHKCQQQRRVNVDAVSLGTAGTGA